MGLTDSIRQLFLLLWKNFILRSRKKVRVVVEILWPLFLFLILMWVRTRGLRTFEKQCHFAERPLPSSGIFPFVRGYICELNNSCANQPRRNYYTDEVKNLTQLTSDVLQFINQPQFFALANDTANLITTLNNVRQQSAQVTRNLTLQEVLFDPTRFKQNLTSFLTMFNSSLINSILNSNPNFNYLYSNFSQAYTEPIPFASQLNLPQAVFDILYGPDLDMLQINRGTNQVYNPTWIRGQMCLNNTNYLLRGDYATKILAPVLCNLNDTELAGLFVRISSELDFTKTKQIVSDSVDFTKLIVPFLNFQVNLLKTQSSLNMTDLLAKNGYSSWSDVLNITQNIDLQKLACGDSQLNIFSILSLVNLKNINPGFFTGLVSMLNQKSLTAEGITRIFDESINNIHPGDFDDTVFNYKLNTLKQKTSDARLASNTSYQNTSTQQTTTQSTSSSFPAAIDILKGFNNLNSLPASKCPVRLSPPTNDSIDQLLANSTTKTCFCQTTYAILNGISQGTRTLFGQIRPMLLGKILYSPNTPAYQKLIKRMNSTYANIELIALSLRDFGNFASNFVKDYKNLTTNANFQSVLNLTQLILNVTQQDLTSANIDLENLLSQIDYYATLSTFISNSLFCLELNKFEGFQSEGAAVKTGLKLIDREAFFGVVAFQDPAPNDYELPKLVKYKIRMNSSQTHDTRYTQDRFYSYGASLCLGCNSYFLYGFIYVQDMLERAIVEYKTNQSQDFGVVGQMTPYPCYINDKFVTAISRTLPLFMVLAWIYTVSMMVKDIVYEKEKRLKEFMRVMGLTNATHWAAWFITSFVLMYFVGALLCLVLKFGKITTFTNLSVLLVFFCCFTMATITQCFLISTFFNKANLAAVVAGIFYFILYLPYTILVNYGDSILPWQKFLASLSSTVAFSYGCELIATFELQQIGIDWTNFYSTPFSTKDNFSMNTICLILLFDSFLYMLLTWYVEGVAPGEFGLPRPWYFPVQASYWCGDRKRFKPSSTKNDQHKPRLAQYLSSFFFDTHQKIIEDEELNEKTTRYYETLENSVEKSSSNLTPGIEIVKLHKVYSRGSNHALKGLTLNFYQNEISAFLGHNGAGKSTTMHLLTGLYTPSSGMAKINGLDITESMDSIRKSLGFVPQHNVLFPGLTVKEHLWFYARLKGHGKLETLNETDKMLEDTGLEPKRNEFSKNLSGGMQRKLSVAIAFVGGSKTVILDEPSAGVDPSGRRSIWDLLFKYREGRTIVISTHHMDEADVLGDRIAIISNGKLIAHGSGYFLKSKFGRGYCLTFAKKDLDDEEDEIDVEGRSISNDSGAGSMSSQRIENSNNNNAVDNEITPVEEEEALIKTLTSSQDKKIMNFVKSRVPGGAVLVANSGSEMTFTISNRPSETKDYAKLFLEIEANLDSLGIESMGISDTTLEEIFIKLAKEPSSVSFKSRNYKFFGIDLEKIKSKICRRKKAVNEPLTPEKIELYSTYTKARETSQLVWVYMQLYALLIKRFHRVKRNVKGFFAEIVLPVVFVCLALLVATLTPATSDRPPLELHPWYYPTPNRIFISESSSPDFERPFFTNSKYQSQVNLDKQPNYASVKRITQALVNSPGPGTRCMKEYKIVIQSQAVDSSRALGNKVLDCENFVSSLIQNYTYPSQTILDQFYSTNFSYTKRSLECDCQQGFPQCPASAGGDIQFRPIYALKTKDVLYDVTSRNVTDWIIKTEFTDEFFRKRYGGYEFLTNSILNTDLTAQNILANFNGLIQRGTALFSQFNANVKSAPSSNNSLDGTNPIYAAQNVKIWYNLKGYDASVSYLNVLNNAILRSKLNELNESVGFDASEHGIVAINHPMNFTRTQFLNQLENRLLIDLFVAIFIIFALSFIPASFLVFVLEERENHSKQLQFVSGVKPYIYWISNFTWDILNYIVPCVLCIIIFVIFNVQSYMSPENFPCLVCLMFLYGWSCIPLMYPLNYFFDMPSTAFVISSSMNVFIGVITTITTTFLNQLGDDEPDLLKVNAILKPVFLALFPHYCLGQGFLEMSLLYNTAMVKRGFGIQATFNPFAFDSVGRNLLAMAFQGVFYFILNLLIQYKFFIRFKPTNNLEKLNLPKIENEDDDVKSEKMRLLNNVTVDKNLKKKFRPFNKLINRVNNSADKKENNSDYIKLINLTKIYKKFQKFKMKRHVAVNAVTVGINKGECFGLIGVNGAGKTTTFKMITGDIGITGGDIYVNGHSVSKQIERVHRNIGYCPQTDAIMPLLTAREHLIFFARLRGIPEKYVKQVSEWAMNRVGLTVFADRISGDFSGGNKRKLSTAIALVGDPSVICLDEPTSGMDAKARRFLWSDILSLIKENRIVILTSHSMEECEALCTRLVIMVNGQFKCLGSPQHLKSKFGSGFKLSIRLEDEKAGRETLVNFMRDNFPDSIIQESHKNMFEFILPFKHTKLSDIFGKIEASKVELNIKDYSMSQTTLDQIFVNFAKAQIDDKFVDSDALRIKEESEVKQLVNLGEKSPTSLSIQSTNTLTNIGNMSKSSIEEKQLGLAINPITEEYLDDNNNNVGKELNGVDDSGVSLRPESRHSSLEMTHL